MSYGIPSTFITENHPNRYVLDNCLRTQGPAPGRDTSCMICLEEITAEDMTITHGLPGQGGCSNTFHSACFDGLVASAKLADDLDPAGANSNEPDRKFAKCPLCRAALYPYEKQGCRLPPALEAERECARFGAVERAAAGSETGFGDDDEDFDEELLMLLEHFAGDEELLMLVEQLVTDDELMMLVEQIARDDGV